jgi:hypothetical protein
MFGLLSWCSMCLPAGQFGTSCVSWQVTQYGPELVVEKLSNRINVCQYVRDGHCNVSPAAELDKLTLEITHFAPTPIGPDLINRWTLWYGWLGWELRNVIGKEIPAACPNRDVLRIDVAGSRYVTLSGNDRYVHRCVCTQCTAFFSFSIGSCDECRCLVKNI